MNPSAASKKRSTDAETKDSSRKSKQQKIVIDLTSPPTSSTSPLCAHCQPFNLDLKFAMATAGYQRLADGLTSFPEGIYEAPDGSYFYNDAVCVHVFEDQLSNPSDCPLCQFFRSLRVQPERYQRHKLLAFRSSDSWLFRPDKLRERKKAYQKYKDTVFMAVVPHVDSIPLTGHLETWLTYDIPATGAIYHIRSDDTQDPAQKPPLLEARELGDKAPLDGVREWLDRCRSDHGKACMRRASQEPISQYFRLINCVKEVPVSENPPVEDQPWGVTYATLSYVWGVTPEDLKDWPKTVLDAVEVTKRLGLEYLWVDRLCIDQSNPTEKAYLISRMSTIYDQAEFTIVAAAGSGASHGLPGVLSTPRLPQPKYHLDSGNMLLSILRDPRRDILESQYWSRGWTYQEGVLSNRRIVFTDQQVYWECRCMATHESAAITMFHMPASHEETSDQVMAGFMLAGIFKGDAYSGGVTGDREHLVIDKDEDYRLDYGFLAHREASVRAQLRGLNEHTREFSKRRLTHDTDTLPAFLGIIGLYEKTPQLRLLHGIPIWTGNFAGRTTGSQITFALTVSSWYHRAGTDHYMFVSEPCRRKTLLPSWTWAGWEGTVTWRAPPNLEHCAYMSDLIKAENLNLLWAADIYFSSPDLSQSIPLLGVQSGRQVVREAPTLIEIRNPFFLNTFERVEDTKKEWIWRRRVGRPGRERVTSQASDWDAKWYRIGRRLSCVAMSVQMTEKEWTEKHESGEIISVLIFAGKYLDNEHGSARFLTLRRVESASRRWERIGMLTLVIPFLANCLNNQAMFGKIPVKSRNRNIVIQ
jgi:hypothetical protein